VPALERQIEEKVHNKAQESFYREEANSEELGYFLNKSDSSLCSIELHEGSSCRENEGTSKP